MPVVLNIATNLAFGAALVLVMRQSRALRQDFMSWQLLALAAFEALIFTPVATYLFRFYPQWSLLYLFDPQLYPNLDRFIGPLSMLAVLLNFGALIGGYTAARLGVLRDNLWITTAPIGVGALLWVVTLLLAGERIVFLGDFDSFWQGSAVILLKRVAGWVALALHGAMVAFVITLHRHFGKADPRVL